MDEGIYLRRRNGTRLPVYAHSWRCQETLAADRRQWLADNAESLAAGALWDGGVPPPPRPSGTSPASPDGEPYASLADYARRHPELCDFGGTHHDAVRVCTLFVRYCQRHGYLPQNGFALQGPLGRGKTTLMLLTVREAIAGIMARQPGNAKVLYWEAPVLANEVRRAVKRGNLDAIVGELTRAPLLVIDDLGAEDPSPYWINQVLFPVVNARWVAGTARSLRRPILLTARRPLAEVQTHWLSGESARGTKPDSAEAVVSRLQQQGMWVPIGAGDDFRVPGADFALDS